MKQLEMNVRQQKTCNLLLNAHPSTESVYHGLLNVDIKYDDFSDLIR